MRVPNDKLLLEQVEEIDLVLGGHDHHYYTEQVGCFVFLLAYKCF
jgi:hypothetical protein